MPSLSPARRLSNTSPPFTAPCSRGPCRRDVHLQAHDAADRGDVHRWARAGSGAAGATARGTAFRKRCAWRSRPNSGVLQPRLLPALPSALLCVVVAMNEHHLQEMVLEHAVPPPVPPGSSAVSLVRMGFPPRNPEALGAAAFCGEAWRRGGATAGSMPAHAGLHSSALSFAAAPPQPPACPPHCSRLPARLRHRSSRPSCRFQVPAAAGRLHLPAVQGAGGRAAQLLPRVRPLPRVLPPPSPLIPPSLPCQTVCRGAGG